MFSAARNLFDETSPSSLDEIRTASLEMRGSSVAMVLGLNLDHSNTIEPKLRQRLEISFRDSEQASRLVRFSLKQGDDLTTDIKLVPPHNTQQDLLETAARLSDNLVWTSGPVAKQEFYNPVISDEILFSNGTLMPEDEIVSDDTNHDRNANLSDCVLLDPEAKRDVHFQSAIVVTDTSKNPEAKAEVCTSQEVVRVMLREGVFD